MSLHSCSHRAGSLQGPHLQLQSQLRPPQPRRFPASPETRGASGKGRPRKPCTRGGERALSLCRKRGDSTLGFHNPQTFPTSPISHSRPPCRQSWLIETRAGSHLTPRAGFPKQTATGNSNEIQKGNCSYCCPTHTHVPSSPPHPFLLGSEAQGLCCRAAPAQTHPMPGSCGTAEQRGPGSVAGETSPG